MVDWCMECRDYHPPQKHLPPRAPAAAAEIARLRALLARNTKALDGARAALDEAALQIEYLHSKFQETGSGNATLARIHAELGPLPPR